MAPLFGGIHMRGILLTTFLVGAYSSMLGAAHAPLQFKFPHSCVDTNLSFQEQPTFEKGGWQFNTHNPVGKLIKDIFELNANLLSWTSYKIIGSTFPLFIGGRMVDIDLQNCFYCKESHKNINQLPKGFQTFAKWSIGVPIAFFGSQIFWQCNEELRETAWVFMIGMPFVIFGKEIIKKLRINAARRPWNEYFSCDERAFGGFPSGHMAEATYMAFLYGWRYGPRYGAPLGCVAGLVAVAFVNCNRHYLSQIVAGAGLGMMYAFAANKLIDKNLCQNTTLTFSLSHKGAPGVKMAWAF